MKTSRYTFRRTVLAVLVLFLLSATATAAQDMLEPQEPAYGLGDQTFAISAGVNLPLFIHMLSGELEPALGHVGPGATGSIQWGSYLNHRMSVGAELGGMFAFTTLGRTLIVLPLSAVFTYTLRSYPFEFPLHATVGVSFMKVDEDLYVGPAIKPGASAYWNYSSEWAFGLRLEYWWVPEIYFGTLSDQSAFGNFMSITLSTLYHF